MSGCLSENVVAALVMGSLPGADLEAAESHLDGCASCREVVAHALRDESSEATHIGRYRVLRKVGAGSMGRVYAAQDPDLGREIAIKVLRPSAMGDSDTGRARFVREARAMARLQHPNVITVHEVGTADGQLFIAMELVKGATLEGWLHLAPRGWREVAEVMCAAGRGLAAAHAAGVVHRDFKPDNVLVGDDGRVRVTDFGLAHLAASEAPPAAEPPAPVEAPALGLTAGGALIGTPVYMSPEQLRGDVADERSDLFSFCATFWEALYGERPFIGTTLEELEAAVSRGDLQPRAPALGVPAALHDALARGLRPAADERWPSMAALLSVLERVAAPRRALSRPGFGLFLLTPLAVGAAVLLLHRPHRWQPHIVELPVYEENADTPVFSPDGTMIAYPADREEPGVPRIYVAPLHGGTPRAVSPPALTGALHPRWSRDGRWLLFTDVQKHRGYRISVTGGALEPIAESATWIEDCAGRLVIVYDAAPDCPHCQRLVLRARDGAERELVRFETNQRAGFPHCDAAGQRVVYSLKDNITGGPTGYNSYDLWVLDVDGGAPRRLTSDRAGNVGAWAPDGRSVVFSAIRGGQKHLWELALDSGAAPVQLTFGAGWEQVPDVSRDGKLVIFDFDITTTQLFAQPMAGGVARKLTADIQSVEDPQPTPDGRAIVALAMMPSLANQIVSIPLDGGDPRALVEGREPSLTRDGREVVYTVSKSGRVLAVPVGGGAARAITQAPGPVVDLTAGSDGRVHMTVARGDSWEAWSAPLAGGSTDRELPAPWTMLEPAPHGGWRVAVQSNPYVCRFLPPGAGLDDPHAYEVEGDHAGTWTADGKSWLFIRDSRVHRFFVETREDRVVSEPSDYGGVAASADGRTLFTTQTIGRVRRELITNFADRH